MASHCALWLVAWFRKIMTGTISSRLVVGVWQPLNCIRSQSHDPRRRLNAGVCWLMPPDFSPSNLYFLFNHSPLAEPYMNEHPLTPIPQMPLSSRRGNNNAHTHVLANAPLPQDRSGRRPYLFKMLRHHIGTSILGDTLDWDSELCALLSHAPDVPAE